ncbi:MAG TPA: DNA polymerase III subunit delta' [Steroidobacteraceae bacterium]|nr:DNA polymerase III subunit delta' [Steroidobacteraceae bacterium]
MAQSDPPISLMQSVKPEALPWHASAVAHLRRSWSAQRVPHALLIQGANGIGKRNLAAWLSAALLCESKTENALDRCGNCTSCKLIAAGSHPDLNWVVPEEDKQQVSIDQLREACDRLTRTSFRQGYKIAIIDPAHQMTPGAANSLLKTLEEPSRDSLLILLTSRPSALLATIRSRCQRVSVAGPTAQEAIEWLAAQTGKQVSEQLLAFAGQAPLRALAYADGRFDALDESMSKSLGALLSKRTDVTQVAAEWAKDELDDRLIWLDLWLNSWARQAVGGTADQFTFPTPTAHLPSPPRTLNISGVYSMVDRARALRVQLSRTALQRELAVESWLIALLDVLTPRAASTPRGLMKSNR